MKYSNRYLKLLLALGSLGVVLGAFQNCGEGFKAEAPGDYSSSSIAPPGPNPQPVGNNPPAPPPPPPPPPMLKNQWLMMSTSGAPSARTSHSAVWTGTRMIVFGGFGNGTYFNNGGLYDPATNTWEPISTTGAPSPRSGHTAVWTGTRMIVFGGRRIEGANVNSLNDGGIYDPATNTWQPISATGAPGGRVFHSAVWTGTRMIVFGGSQYSGTSEVPYGDGGIYDPTTNTWQTVSSIPNGRGDHTAVWTGTRMLVFGGFSSTASSVTLLSVQIIQRKL